jgi:hypothetical protein
MTPYKIIDRRGTGYGSANNLFLAATTSTERRDPGRLDRDTDRIWSMQGRQTMLSFGRAIIANFDEVRAATFEMACYATSTFLPQYRGANRAWGKMAEEWLADSEETFDVRGWPYNRSTYLRNLVISAVRDGEQYTLPCVLGDVPQIQSIGAHRVYGNIDGAVDGVKQTPWGAVTSYRVYGAQLNSRTFQAKISSLRTSRNTWTNRAASAQSGPEPCVG